jgi:hypothetical protein
MPPPLELPRLGTAQAYSTTWLVLSKVSGPTTVQFAGNAGVPERESTLM